MTEDTLEDPLTAYEVAELASPLAAPGRWGASSSRGRVRTRNEDAWGEAGGFCFVVADGMGGYPGGDVASAAAVGFFHAVAEQIPAADWSVVGAELNRHVRQVAQQAGHQRAGTALAAVVANEGVATIVHVGDVRVYRHHHDRLVCLTEDHTVATEAGAGLGEDVIVAGRRVPPHALTRFLGGPDDRGRPTVATIVPRSGDRLMLLTDGVYRQIGPLALASLAKASDPQRVADALVNAADDAGGQDNATALVVDFSATPPPLPLSVPNRS